ncbi:1-acylglycerol-3-phosphate O-acyltransferase [Nocardia stercoris]|uniref:1-acyl-sn-glycerol-3-phosphate acyltransferase n=1 Tax=Nocardia stercoris TaxID=2483361 RepID=A0A3M2KVI9_9NOCA|nr:1-acylglycerol-3-phosphate O-acyltransferase [Nocardia stercoris]RMI29642.1 1-acylglycerol-3-phosphate O-acyltransferase [Nocardia stercoris]
MDLDAAVAAVAAGPQGPQVAAIFEVGAVADLAAARDRRPDRRVLPAPVAGRAELVAHGLSPKVLWHRRRSAGAAGLARSMRDGVRSARTDAEYEGLLQSFRSDWAGHSEDELAEAGTRAYQSSLYGHLYPEAWRLVRAHRVAGHTLILITGLTRFQVEPVGAELGFPTVLHTELAVVDGVLTGHVDGTPLWRTEKAEAVRRFAQEWQLDPAQSYIYAASSTDLPLLESAGHPRVVNPDPQLASVAGERQWPVLTFRPRPDARLRDLIRTAAGFAALLSGATVGVVSRSATRDRRRMADAMIRQAAAATLRTTGIRIRVTGARYARDARPAVFVFNHQSQFDMVILASVLDHGVTAVAKQELTANPIFGPMLRFVGVTFIDRSDSAAARAALAPVVDTLHQGISVVVAPEGTRSRTPEVGAFKKGAFHIAMQAGVPVVPLVIRNAGEIAWRDSAIVRKGVVDVAVLPPVDVSGWDPRQLDAEVDRVRELFVQTLLNWPAPDADSD